MTLNIVSSFNGVSDPDAAAYIEAVEAADGELLEFAVGKAINDFVLGCKADGIWDAIKASCILAGARTLDGALVPLTGEAPTSYNFVAGDYDRKTGLVGDGSTKYLSSNRPNNADPQDSSHNAVYVSDSGNGQIYQGAAATGAPTNQLGVNITRNRSGASVSFTTFPGFTGMNRNSSIAYNRRTGGTDDSVNQASSAVGSEPVLIFARGIVGSISAVSSARLAFYSIGESLDLALLDARVTNMITAFGAAIP